MRPKLKLYLTDITGSSIICLPLLVFPPPNPEDYENCIKHSRDSACGRDGVGYSAYKANVSLSGRVLHNSVKDLSLEQPRTNLEDFNIQKCWFAPKGVVAEDKTACIRTADKFRTILGSNCDSKLISGTIAFQFILAVLLLTPMNQRGFCKGRQLSLNSVDLDVFMRFFNAKFDLKDIWADRIGDIPVTVLYDFCNAFPTILHSFCSLFLGVLVSLCFSGMPYLTFIPKSLRIRLVLVMAHFCSMFFVVSKQDAL